MHMADALLSPAVGATFWAGSLGTIAYCAKKLKESMDEKMIPLMGVLGAFIFAAQMINFTIPGTGSSGHLGGGMILAVILGPHAAFIVMASVLTIQAFFFADGGLLALGCNIWNLGIYPCFIAYPLIYRPLIKSGSAPKRIVMASVISAAAGLQLGAFSVVLQTLMSGQSDLPFGAFTLMMQPLHLAIGLVEGFVTAGVINFVRAARPEILESTFSARPLASGISIRRIVAGLLIAAVITGGVLSWFASANPDGLEWSIRKVFGKTELPEQRHGIAPTLKSVQKKTAFLPDYGFKKPEGTGEDKGGTSRPAVDPGTSASGIVGAGLVLAALMVIGAVIKTLRRKPF
ncbi:MAG TPA: energy-coupling factor ABC transporter permease [Thermodesulfovibrionales bacterium]|nr:energy-coupling factor ABC transporter permease [Thermodesulfovibrionales bacterium]